MKTKLEAVQHIAWDQRRSHMSQASYHRTKKALVILGLSREEQKEALDYMEYFSYVKNDPTFQVKEVA